jgi:Ca-activated chloride channel family protein
MIMTATQPTPTSLSAGGRLVTSDGRALPLQGAHLSAQAGGGIARVTLTQRFRNPYDQPLKVRYLLPLPSDGAVSGFAFTLGDERVVGEVADKQEARRRFQRALARGQTAAMVEQDRTSLFTQTVGNVPPGGEVVTEVIVDQPLRWLEEGAWEWRFPTVVGPRYQGAPGRVADAAKLSVPVADAPLQAGATLALSIADRLTGSVESPSHPVEAGGEEPVEVRFDRDGAARLDRDVVVRWPVALPDVSATVAAARPSTAAHDGDTFALFTVAPPTDGWTPLARDLTFLIDTSGSMGGRPLEQARRVVSAMIETLNGEDRIELIEFGSRPRRWKKSPLQATAGNKTAALKWIGKLRASGSTEMHRAVLEALKPLRPRSQRQVILITDGYIGFEQEIVRTLLNDLPDGARLHTVGVGSSVNRSLTEAAARAGRGVELIVGIDEDADRLVHRLLAKTTAPLVTDLVLEGDGVLEVAPQQLPDLYAESPALISARLAASGGEVVLRGNTAQGPFERRFQVPELERGQGSVALAKLFGREKVEDLETALTAGGDTRELEEAVRETGLEFQIATRLTSWIAVSERITVDPDATKVAVDQPHELPHGVSAEGLGLRAPRSAEEKPTIVLTDSDRRLGTLEVTDELILEDATSETVINLGALTGKLEARSTDYTDLKSGLAETEAFELMEDEADGVDYDPFMDVDDAPITRTGLAGGGPSGLRAKRSYGQARGPRKGAASRPAKLLLLLAALLILALTALLLWALFGGVGAP